MGLSFLSAQVVSDGIGTLPPIVGRGREATPYEPDATLVEATVAFVNAKPKAGQAATIATAVKVKGTTDPKVVAEVQKLNKWAKSSGNVFHFVVRTDADDRNVTRVFLVAGPAPEYRRNRKAGK